MKIIQLGKGQGKTTEMLVWLLEGHVQNVKRALIVPTMQDLNRVRTQLRIYYNTHGRPKYISDAANRIYTVEGVRKLRSQNLDNCEIGIDDADVVLAFLLGLNRRPSILSVTDPDPSTDKP